jgi:hypothetical protein
MDEITFVLSQVAAHYNISNMASTTSPFHGYTQVESFSDANDYIKDENGEIEEETVYVTLDIGPVDATLLPNSSHYRLVVSEIPSDLLE